MSKIAVDIHMVPERVLREQKEKAISNWYEGQLMIGELTTYVDSEVARLEQAHRDAVFCKRTKVAIAIQMEIHNLKIECKEWFNTHGKRMCDLELKHKKYRQRREKRGGVHKPYSFTKDVQKVQALRTKMKEKGRYGIDRDLAIGSDQSLKFKNVQNPREAELSSYDIHNLFFIVCDWYSPQFMKTHKLAKFIRPEGDHISLSVFLPPKKGGKNNRKVYIQLSRDLAVFEFTGKKNKKGKDEFRFNWEQTLKNVQADFAFYYREIIEGNAGDDISDIDHKQANLPGTRQVSRLEYFDSISEFMSSGNMMMKYEPGDMNKVYMSKALGKGYRDHPDNVKAREEIKAWYECDEANKHEDTSRMDDYLLEAEPVWC